MSYYDFNEHFWSPQEVCAIAPQKKTQTGFVNALLRTFCEIFFSRQPHK